MGLPATRDTHLVGLAERAGAPFSFESFAHGLRRLSVCLAGPDKNAEDADDVLFPLGKEKDSVVAQTPAEHTFPFIALKSFHIALEGVGLHLAKRAGDLLLKGLGKIAQVPLRVFGEVTAPVHL